MKSARGALHPRRSGNLEKPLQLCLLDDGGTVGQHAARIRVRVLNLLKYAPESASRARARSLVALVRSSAAWCALYDDVCTPQDAVRVFGHPASAGVLLARYPGAL